jgi:hypothetical protein
MELASRFESRKCNVVANDASLVGSLVGTVIDFAANHCVEDKPIQIILDSSSALALLAAPDVCNTAALMRR